MNELLKVSDDNLKISEVFATIQGEGLNTGMPVIFIRFNLCNLSCIWCDTPFTWNWTGTNYLHRDMTTGENLKYDPVKEIKVMTADEVITKVLDLQVQYPGIKNIVISGGEPLIHQRSPQFEVLLSKLKHTHNFFIEVETNGTLIPQETVASLVDQFNVSPKLANSNNSEVQRTRPKAYAFFTTCNKAMFKFVVTSDEDMKEIIDLRTRFFIPASKIMLMPEGRTAEETARRAQELVEECKKEGYRYCNRLHVQIWHGAVRGV